MYRVETWVHLEFYFNLKWCLILYLENIMVLHCITIIGYQSFENKKRTSTLKDAVNQWDDVFFLFVKVRAAALSHRAH